MVVQGSDTGCTAILGRVAVAGLWVRPHPPPSLLLIEGWIVAVGSREQFCTLLLRIKALGSLQSFKSNADSLARQEEEAVWLLTVLGSWRHVEVDLLTMGVEEPHQQLLHGAGVVGSEGGPVGRIHGYLSNPLAVLS